MSIVYSKNIFSEKQIASNVYVIAAGEVELYHKDTFLCRKEVGDTFGSISLTSTKTNRSYHATATARTNVLVYELTQDQWKSYVRTI